MLNEMLNAFKESFIEALQNVGSEAIYSPNCLVLVTMEGKTGLMDLEGLFQMPSEVRKPVVNRVINDLKSVCVVHLTKKDNMLKAYFNAIGCDSMVVYDLEKKEIIADSVIAPIGRYTDSSFTDFFNVSEDIEIETYNIKSPVQTNNFNLN